MLRGYCEAAKDRDGGRGSEGWLRLVAKRVVVGARLPRSTQSLLDAVRRTRRACLLQRSTTLDPSPHEERRRQGSMNVGRIIEVLVDYTHHPLEPDQVDVVPDLQIIDLYAVRVAGVTDYIVHVGSGKVEEVSFTLWPPQQRAP
jgi:hypothetical protein